MNPADPTLRFIYRMVLRYTAGWSVDLPSRESGEQQHFFLAEGHCEGRITGTFRAANHPRRRGDGTFEPDVQGVITTSDGAAVYFDHRGYGRSYPVERRQIVASGTHVSDHSDYTWLNDTVAAGVGEVRQLPAGDVEIVMDWFELIWAPLPAED